MCGAFFFVATQLLFLDTHVSCATFDRGEMLFFLGGEAFSSLPTTDKERRKEGDSFGWRRRDSTASHLECPEKKEEGVEMEGKKVPFREMKWCSFFFLFLDRPTNLSWPTTDRQDLRGRGSFLSFFPPPLFTSFARSSSGLVLAAQGENWFPLSDRIGLWALLLP